MLTPGGTVRTVLLSVLVLAALAACGGLVTGSDQIAAPNLDAGSDQEAGSRPTDASVADGTGSDGAPGSDASAGDTGTTDPTAATSYLINPAHTASLQDPTLAPPLTLAWTHDFGFPFAVSYPLVAGGDVYLLLTDDSSGASDPLQLVALDEATGAIAWGPVAVPTSEVGGAHAYDGGRVFVAYSTNSGCVASAYDGASGDLAWTVSLGEGVCIEPSPTAYGGILYVMGASLVALDEGTGKTLWSVSREQAEGFPAVADDAVFVGSSDIGQFAFDRLTGAQLWNDQAYSSLGQPAPAIFGGREYLTSVSYGDVVEGSAILDVNTGASLGTFGSSLYPAIDGDIAVLNSRSSPIQAMNLTTGQTVWTFAGDGQLNGWPVIAGGAVYIGSDSGMIFAVDEASGAMLWSELYQELATPVLAVGHGLLLATSESSSSMTAYSRVVDAGAPPDGASSCTTPYGPCGSSCVDLATDPQNCGACGATCMGTCSGGTCTAPVVLATETALTLAVDAAYAYWGNSAGEIRRVAKTGGQPVTLATVDNTYPSSLAVDSQNVYWIAPSNGTGDADASVLQTSLDGGGAVIALGLQLEYPWNIAVSSTTVFWTTTDGTDAVMSVPIGGGTLTPFALGSTGEFSPIAIDADNLYWSTDTATYQEPLAGGQALSIGPAPAALAVDDSYVYFALNGSPTGSIVRVPIGGGAQTTIASGRLPDLMAIAVDATRVYWIEGYGTIGQGAVAAVDKSGGTPVILASGLQDPSAIAVDDSNVYVANTADGEIESIAK